MFYPAPRVEEQWNYREEADKRMALTQGYLASDFDPEHGSQSPQDLVVSSDERWHHWDRAECPVALIEGGAGEDSLAEHPSPCWKGLCSSEGQGIKHN